jgi:polyketide biosynthesis acyl carrier protein
MTKNTVLEIVRQNTVEVLGGISPGDVRLDVRLKDLGANSIDRVEITTLSMEALGVTIPLVELAKVSNIGELVDALHAKCGGA